MISHPLKVYLWAAMHSPYFWQCYLYAPLAVRFRRYRTSAGWTHEIRLEWNKPGVYIPWGVKRAYELAQDTNQFDQFDDIPF